MWRVRPGQALRHRGWDGEFVLYNDLSGDTHLIGEAALAVLLALARGPATAAALEAALAEPEADSASAAGALDELLASLRTLHLVEPC